MNNRLDKVFKDKLESHQLSPSPAAWDKLERQLAKKNKAYVWLRAAAVLALFSLATVVAINWPATNTPNHGVAKKENSEPKQTEPEKIQPATNEQATEQLPVEPMQVAETKKSPTPFRSHPVREEKPTQDDQPEQQPIERNDVPELVAEATPVIEQAPVVAEVVEQQASKPVVIVYTLPAIPRKDATQLEEEKKTGFQRVLEVANNVKNADNPFGELREAKNDLFALEFRREKDKNKNNN